MAYWAATEQASRDQVREMAAHLASSEARSDRLEPGINRGAPSLERAPSSIEREVRALVDQGEEQLLRQQAAKHHELAQQRNAKGRIELGMTELSHLHAQLNSMTTQCTLLVGFALAGIGADTLSELANDVSQFCLYKSMRAQVLGTSFILVTTLAIFFSMTVISCAQTIAAESNCRMFDYDDTRQVVKMTHILMHGDRTEVGDGRSRITRWVVISRFFEGAIFSFFLATVLAIWLFFGTNNWVNVSGEDAYIMQPKGRIGENATAPNPYMIYTTEQPQARGGRFKVQCSDPYNEDQSEYYDFVGTSVAILASLFFLLCFLAFVLTRCYVARMYSSAELRKLGAQQATELQEVGAAAV